MTDSEHHDEGLDEATRLRFKMLQDRVERAERRLDEAEMRDRARLHAALVALGGALVTLLAYIAQQLAGKSASADTVNGALMAVLAGPECARRLRLSRSARIGSRGKKREKANE